MIRLARPDLSEHELDRVREVLATGMLVQGLEVRAFEAAVADYVGVAHAVAVSNCTCALQLALQALGVGRGDIVVVGAYSWPASGNVVALLGATPVFVDIDPRTFNMDPDQLNSALCRLRDDPATAGRVKAVMPIHIFGLMADMRAIGAVCRGHSVPMVEDAACALGASLDGRKAGAWGDLGCFSFHPRKAITTGEGGMVVTNNADLARQLRILRNHGLDPDAAVPDFVAPGYNMRLTEFQAALGASQMARVDAMLARRRSQAAAYDALFAGSTVSCPTVAEGCAHAFQAYVVLLPTAARHRRAQVIAALLNDGIETTIGTYLMPFTTYFRSTGGFHPGDFPVGEDVYDRALALPLHPGLTDGDQEQVAHRLLAHLG